MYLIFIGGILIGLSIFATFIIGWAVARTQPSRFIAWYLENWIAITLSLAIFVLAIDLSLLFLAPRYWWGDYSQTGVSILDQIWVSSEVIFICTIIPGLFLVDFWERIKAGDVIELTVRS